MLDIETRGMDAKVANDAHRHLSNALGSPVVQSSASLEQYSLRRPTDADVALCSAAVVGQIDDLTRAATSQETMPAFVEAPPTFAEVPPTVGGDRYNAQLAASTPQMSSAPTGGLPSLGPVCASVPQMALSTRSRHVTYSTRSAEQPPPPSVVAPPPVHNQPDTWNQIPVEQHHYAEGSPQNLANQIAPSSVGHTAPYQTSASATVKSTYAISPSPHSTSTAPNLANPSPNLVNPSHSLSHPSPNPTEPHRVNPIPRHIDPGTSSNPSPDALSSPDFRSTQTRTGPYGNANPESVHTNDSPASNSQVSNQYSASDLSALFEDRSRPSRENSNSELKERRPWSTHEQSSSSRYHVTPNSSQRRCVTSRDHHTQRKPRPLSTADISLPSECRIPSIQQTHTPVNTQAGEPVYPDNQTSYHTPVDTLSNKKLTKFDIVMPSPVVLNKKDESELNQFDSRVIENISFVLLRYNL